MQGALIAMDPQTGFILALVGGRDFSASQFNRATQAKRQAGSAFKPIVHAAALDKGFTPATIIVDEPIAYVDVPGKEPWEPKNFDREFWGPITMRKALAFSRNLPTVKIAQAIGLEGTRRRRRGPDRPRCRRRRGHGPAGHRPHRGRR